MIGVSGCLALRLNSIMLHIHAEWYVAHTAKLKIQFSFFLVVFFFHLLRIQRLENNAHCTFIS